MMENTKPTTWNDLKGIFVGLDSQIDAIQECLIGFKRPNIALLGVPGTAKTKLAQAIGGMLSHGSTFYDGEWTATSTPSHFLGPQSFPRLMEAEELVHKTDGYPPDCEIFHAEEGFKAQGPLLDLLLPYGEENRKYMNGKRLCYAKTIVWLISSNELPNESNGALCDRFAIVFFPRLDNIVDRFQYSKRVSGKDYDVLESITPNPSWSVEKVQQFHDDVKDIEIPSHTLMVWEHILDGIRNNTTRESRTVRASASETFYRGNMQERGMVTGRGHRLGLMLAKARAFTECSKYVEPQHLCASLPVLVVDPDFRDGVEEIVHSWAIPNADHASACTTAGTTAMKQADNLIKKQFSVERAQMGFNPESDNDPVDPEVFRDCIKAIKDAKEKLVTASKIYSVFPRLGKTAEGKITYHKNRSAKTPKELSYKYDKLTRYEAHISELYTQSLQLNEA